MHKLTGNVKLEPSIVAASYTEGSTDPSPIEVDVKDSQSVMLFADVSTLNTAELVLHLQGAEESGGNFEDLGTVSITETGQFKVEVQQPPRYIQITADQDSSTEDVFGAYVLAGNAETLPLN